MSKEIDSLEEEKKQIQKRLKEIKELEKNKEKKFPKIRKRIIHLKEKDKIKNKEEAINMNNMNKKVIKEPNHSNNTTNQSNKTINLGLLIVIVIIVSIASGLLGALLVIKNVNTSTTNNGVTTSSVKLSETNSIASAVDKVYDTTVVVEGYNKNELTSTGTGFVYKKANGKAYIMTNSHVVSECESIKVLFTNGDELKTELVGSDVYSDIAVLSVKDSDKIEAATMGASDKSKVGDTLFTVGSPEGSNYAGTVTKGVLSAKDRLVEVALTNSQTSDYYMNVLQTDAAINPGNSGGPICNTNGEVIGITNMKLVDDSVEGMGFAIPIEDALTYAETIEKEGKVTRPYIGISMLDLSNSYYLWKAGIMIPEGVEKGVVIYSVEDNSPATKAGLKKGDIITKIGDDKTDTLAEFRYQLYQHKPNDKIKITYIRDGKEQTATVQLGKSE